MTTRILLYLLAGLSVTLVTVCIGAFEASEARTVDLFQLSPYPRTAAEGVMFSTAFSSGVVLGIDQQARLELAKELLGSLDPSVAIRNPDTAGPAFTHRDDLNAVLNRRNRADWGSIAQELWRNGEKLQIGTSEWPIWVNLRVGHDPLRNELWDFQYTCASGAPFRCMSHTLLAATVSRNPNSYLVEIEDGVPCFNPMRGWLDEVPLDRLEIPGPTPPFGWQRLALPTRVHWTALALNIGLWSALCAIVHGLTRLPSAVQRHARRRRGACEQCGYSLAGQSLCPECGRLGAQA
jgi:hypothetical protein